MRKILFLVGPVAVAASQSCAASGQASTSPAASPGDTSTAAPGQPSNSAADISWLGPHDRPEDVATRRGVQVKYFDLNHDHRPDVYRFYTLEADPQNAGATLEHTVRKEVDINQDGRIDVVRIYDADDKLTQELDDLDFDGKVDETSFFTDGALVRKELDLDFDGKPDVIKFYSAGHLVRIEADRNRRGKVDTWEYYENDVLNRVGMDTDGDGQVDAWQRPAASPASPGKAAQSPKK